MRCSKSKSFPADHFSHKFELYRLNYDSFTEDIIYS